MFTGRSYGGTPVMSSPSMKMRPDVGVSKPPSMRKQRGLAATRGAEQTEDLALVDVQTDIVDRLEITEGLGDALDPHVGCRVRIPPRGGFDGSGRSAATAIDPS